jgi:energy-coupling factor transporter ATP-binding protein EcfA2
MASKKMEPVLDIELEELELLSDTEELEAELDAAISLDDLTLEVEPEVEVDHEPEAVAVKKPAPKAKIAPALSTIESLITDVDDSVEFLTWVIYGKNGTGKTTLLSTTDGMLILAAEEGTLSIRGKAKDKAKKLKIDSWEKLEAVYWLLKDGTYVKGKGIKIKTAGGEFYVKYVAIDTVTKLVEVCMRNIVLGDKASDPGKDLIKKTLRDWGDMGEKMKYWLQQFEELPIQRVWICQENSNSDDVDSDEFSIFPALNKGLRTYVLSEADIIARTYIAKTDKGVQYRISAAPNANYVTKDRTGAINKAPINNPSLSKLYDVVFGTEE